MIHVDGNSFKSGIEPLRLRRLRLDFIAQNAGTPRPWLGSAWRGLMGHALRSGLCVTGLPDCTDCPLLEECRYPVLFEARPPAEVTLLSRVDRAPGPYLLLASPGRPMQAGDGLSVELRAFGSSIVDAGLLVQALILGASSGQGLQGLRLHPEGILELDGHGRETPVSLQELQHSTVDWQPIDTLPDWPGTFRIQLISPLRLRVKGHYLRPQQLTLGNVLTTLLRRISLLLASYQSITLDLPFREINRLANTLDWKAVSASWQDLERRSSRQHQRVPMGGVLGEFVIDDPRAELFWPLLWLGQWTLLGKGVSMGLGCYRLVMPGADEPACAGRPDSDEPAG